MCRCRRLEANSQCGVALLIAIFSLVLISGVAISLIVMAGTESAIQANYKRSVTAFYAAQAGEEEARERLVRCAPDTLWPASECTNPGSSTDPLFTNNPATVVGQVRYIVNPAPVDPAFNPQTDPPTSPYYDSEYQNEFGTPPVANPAQIVSSSTMTQAGNLPPLAYKWVRITLKNEAMAGVDLDGNGVLDTVTPVRAQATNSQCLPTMPNCSNNPNSLFTTAPIYRVTAFAMEPTGARRLVQTEVAEQPTVNPSGAIASQAAVTINGNFNAFGGWPPIVTATCGSGKSKKSIPTCGDYQNGAVVGDCNMPYDPATDTCNGVPRSHNDYCNQAPAVDSVVSGGNISAGASYSEVPDQTSSCATTKPGCIFTVSPQKALNPNMANWPYDMDQIMQIFQPPVTEPITDLSGVSCGPYDANGNRTCNGQGVKIGTLPSPWPPPPNVQQLNNVPRYVYADVGNGGLLKLTGATSGSGIIVVTGDLAIEAGFQWYGLMLVRGVVTFLGGGSTPTNVYGGILAGKDITNNNTVTGGSVSIVYSSCAYRLNYKNHPLRVLSFREIPQ